MCMQTELNWLIIKYSFLRIHTPTIFLYKTYISTYTVVKRKQKKTVVLADMMMIMMYFHGL